MRAVQTKGPGTSDVLVDEAFGGRLGSDGRVACRLLALATALDSMSRGRAACQAGLERQTLASTPRRRGPARSAQERPAGVA